MTFSLKHAFNSAIPDSGDTTIVQPSNWNAEHTITMATAKMLGRATAGTGAVEEIATTGTGSAVLATSPTFASAITLGTQQTTQGSIALANMAAGAFATTIKASNSATAAWTLTLPPDAGSNTYVLTTNGSGVSSWANPGALAVTLQQGATATTGGSDGKVYYNNNNTTLGEYSITGTGNVVMSASPTLTGTLTAAVGAFSSTLTSTAHTVTSAAATALTVGLNGATNPALQIDASTASSATGIKIKSAAAAAGVALSVITSGTNENLTINAAGSGTIGIGSVSTGIVTITPATTITGALTVSSTTDASSSTTGSIKTAGGLGVAKSLNVGNGITALGDNTFSGTSGNGYVFLCNNIARFAGPVALNYGGANAVPLTFASSGANSQYFAMPNTSSNLIVGVESSGGSAIFSGSSAYAGVIGTDIAKPMQLFANNGLRISLLSAGGALHKGAIQMDNYGAGAATFDSSGNITSVSDARLKTYVEDFTRSIADLRNIGPSHVFDWTEESGLTGRHTGWMLEKGNGMAAAFPEAIGKNKDGHLTFADRPIIAALVNAVLELDARLVNIEGAGPV